MASTAWYYARDGERHGPVSLQNLQALVARGEVNSGDLVWRDGAPQWTAATGYPELFAAPTSSQAARPPAAAAVVAQPRPPVAVAALAANSPAAPAAHGGQAVGYYVPTGNMPPRAVAHLREHASPIGDIGDWPLDDPRVQVFAETMKFRRKVMGAAGLYKALFALSLILALVFLLVALFAAAGGRGGGPGVLEVAVPGAIVLGLAVLYYFGWRATARSHRWAPLTMFVIFMLGVAMNVLSVVVLLGATAAGGAPGAAVGAAMITGLLGSILPLLFAVVSWQAFAAIPRYRAQPAWCQELIAASKL